ncbi:unknown protein [Seminavis robusta]|uniref:Uncharacterized protein n=1 Tax=Seminavis robusta TaxID=568900 RepID=A0A9N8HXR0_9STRA|nr:unknown protein [Seminavis robusta]|eukprot:Sro3277_g346140.1 n/a (386) ;mRNA; f:3328-4790
MAPTTTRDAVEAPKIEVTLAAFLGKEYFQQVEESGEGNNSKILEFMLESRHKAFDWIVNQDPLQLEYDSSEFVVLFYYQTTSPQGSAAVNFCYRHDFFTGETTSVIWGDQWLTESHECQWGGVICETVQTKEKAAVGLHIIRSSMWNQLNGPLPWEITQLPHLKQLHLNGNMLSGMLPPKLHSSSLEQLHLGTNQLSGPIPARWYELHDRNAKLSTSLQIHENRLTGSIPSEVGLFQMELVFLQGNQLSGSLPLTGTFPSEFGLLTNLKGNLHLGHTHISGTLPSEIALLSTLKEIDVSFTNMQGTLPEEMYTGLTDLLAFSGNDCNFSGSISSSLVLLTDLEQLDISNNNFDSTIPNEIEALTELRRLLVNGNQFTGTEPVSVC